MNDITALPRRQNAGVPAAAELLASSAGHRDNKCLGRATQIESEWQAAAGPPPREPR